jgi:hypothetical protein
VKAPQVSLEERHIKAMQANGRLDRRAVVFPERGDLGATLFRE